MADVNFSCPLQPQQGQRQKQDEPISGLNSGPVSLGCSFEDQLQPVRCCPKSTEASLEHPQGAILLVGC